MLVTVPAVGIVPPVAVNVIDVELGILATMYTPPFSKLPVPEVAVISSPTVKLSVVVMPVIVAVQGPVPVIEPTVPVVEIRVVVGVNNKFQAR